MSKENKSFLDESYKLPVASNYLTPFKEGDSTFRILSSAIVGWEYWNKEGKPVRNKEDWSVVPDDIQTDKDGNVVLPKHFWAFVVWNYEAKKVQIVEITQKGIMKYIKGLTINPVWGDPKGYDITVNRSGSGFDTEYTCTANPPSDVDKDIVKKYEAMTINLEALYSGDDPFAKEKESDDIEWNES